MNRLPPLNTVERSNHPISVTLTHEGSTRSGARQLSADYEVVADLLTRTSAYKSPDIPRIKPQIDTRTIIARAYAIHRTLEEIFRDYEKRLAGDTEQRAITDAITNNNNEELRKHGLDFSYVQLDEVIAAFLVGNPPVDIETVGPYLAAHLNPKTDTVEVSMDNVPVDEAVGIQMAAVFKKLTHAVDGKVRIVALLDEFNNYVSERGFTEEEQDAYIVATADLFSKAGVIEPDDEAGKDFLLLRESEQTSKVDRLVSLLQASGKGKVINNTEGELVFEPDHHFIDSLKISSNRRKEFKKKGILLRNDKGKPLCQTLDAAGFLGNENKYLMHIVMLEDHMTPQQDKVFTLLKALGITNEHRYHNIFFDAQNLPPEVIVYGITKKLNAHVEGLIKRLQGQDKFTRLATET